MSELPDYQGKRVLITGGLGFIGSNLAGLLKKLGAEVTILDCSLAGSGANPENIADFRDKVTYVLGDIRNADLVNDLVRDKDVIFSLGAQVDHKLAKENPALDADINCRGQLNVLEAVRRISPQARVLFPGSRLPYGRLTAEDLPVKEDRPLNPIEMYSIHKQTGEAYMRMYHEQHGLDTVVLRLTNPYGPGAQVTNPGYCVANWMLRQAMEDKPLKIFGDGRQLRDYIYVGDVSEAFVIAGLHPSAKGETFNIGSGKGTQFVEMAKIAIRVNGSGELEYVNWPQNYKSVETGDFIADVSKAKSVLGWSAKTDLIDGFNESKKFYESRREYYFK